MRLTPKSDGFHMPAEWGKHRATWMAWPYDIVTFPSRVEKVEKVFLSIIQNLHLKENIELLVLDLAMREKVLQMLKSCRIDIKKITFHLVDYADVWIRDYGPTFLVDKNNNETAWAKWKYNAYGEKFPELLKDDLVTCKIKNYIAKPSYNSNMVMEGGAIDTNGSGVVLTTEQCLLNVNRNKHLDKKQTGDLLKNYLGVEKVIWLKKGLTNDHTDGHVDEIARFVDKNTIVYAYEDDRDDRDHQILEDNLRILQNSTDQDGNHFSLVKLPIPKVNYDDGKKAPASYANFYIANQMVLVPQFGQEKDRLAKEILQAFFPERKIIGIDCLDLIYGGGAVHCITQQQP